MDQSDWIPIAHHPPVGELLLWSSGTYMIGIAVSGIGPDGPFKIFMDPRTDEILPSPSHWMRLPPPP